MLKRVSIQNFKSLKDVTLDLQKVNLLIGPNNSGKTNFLKALEFFKENIYNSINEKNPLFPEKVDFSSDYIYQKSLLNKLSIKLTFETQSLEENSQLSIFKRNASFENFTINSIKDIYFFEHWYSDDENIKDSNFYGKEFYISKNHIDQYLQKVDLFSINPYSLSKPCPLYSSIETVNNDASNVVAFLDTARDNYINSYNSIEQYISELTEDFSQIRLKAVLPNRDSKKIHGDRTYKTFGLFNAKQNITYWADELSEGTLYFVALLCIINQPNPPKLLLLEEPEKGIHPRRLSEILQFILRLVEEKDVQVIMTTHSPTFLDMFKDMPESVFIFDKDEEGATHVKNLQRDVIGPETKRSEELGVEPPHYTDSLGDAWTVGFLGGVPK